MTASVGSVVTLSSQFHFFSFDVMGDLSFGKSFNILSTGKKHFAIQLMDNGITFLGLFTPTPWLARIGFSIPGVATGQKKIFVQSDKQIQEQLESKAKRTDITSWLIEASKQADSMEQGRNWLNGDNFGIIIAGSDTTASTLIFIRTELEHLESGFDGRFLQSLPHLNGLINETLHFHPPVPSAGLRETLLEGLAVADRHIPGYTARFIPVYSLHRRKLQTLLPIHFLSLTLRFSLEAIIGCRCAS